ncbi:hypothetical protein FNV43_RR11736 [Rhamnella rubrinervis]|uniref:B-like cyclin n=1 Tax=Rhamnella rubrinervis TaxID=2594499 RepID=A0A8K0MHW6_9ROSA|nr:hypothetical protein FNV43_RR11736 [Rhamnella rubrinervis]
MDDDFLPSLLCQESDTCLDEEDEDAFISFTTNFNASEEEYVEMLMERETISEFNKDDTFVFGNRFKCARLEAITWILKIRAVFGFRFQTAYLSMTYFDRFLSRRSINNEQLWAIKLLSVACLSLAAKMEELNIPALSEFQLEDYNFESKVIQRMELLVLNTLEWRMAPTTPFAFLPYFITKLWKESPPTKIVSITVGLILATMREINLLEHRPSVIAAAATFVALDQKLTRKTMESKMKSISNYKFLKMEEVFLCYNLMQEIKMDRIEEPKFQSPDLSPTQLSRVAVLETSSAFCIKRRRLAFSNCDQTYAVAEEKRLGRKDGAFRVATLPFDEMLCQNHSRVLIIVLPLSLLTSQSESTLHICLANQKGILTGANFTSHSLFSPMAFASVNVGYANSVSSLFVYGAGKLYNLYSKAFITSNKACGGVHYITRCTSSHTFAICPVKPKGAYYR